MAQRKEVLTASGKESLNIKRIFFLLLGIALFGFVYYCPPWPDAIDPMGKHFVLSQQAKGAIAVFLLAATWWVFEVVPIGVTSLTIGVLQALFMIRGPKIAFKDFMDPSVLFIFGSIVIGMAYVAGAGSIVTLLGAARGAVALGFYKDIMNIDISFFQLTWYMFPVGWLMTFLLWGFFMLFFKPEKNRIPGLQEKAGRMYKELGKWSSKEKLTAAIVIITILVIALKNFIPALSGLHKTGILLTSTIAFFVFNILDVEDLEEIPWNIILLFAGAMSIGFCLWETGAAKWMAVNWLVLFQNSPPIVFILGMAFFVMMMTDFIMNVAAIAISLPVALVIAPYLGVAGEVILFSSLVVAGMPFLLLIGAAPNAIAYNSKQFTTAGFFLWGIPASIMLMLVTWLAVSVIWQLMGMETYGYGNFVPKMVQ